MFGPSYQYKGGLPLCTFSVVILWHTLLTIFSCWSQRPTALSGSDLGRLPRYRRIAKSLNFSRKLKILCCHNTLIMLACFAVWWMTGEVSGGVGGRRGTQINYKVNIFHLDSIYSTFGPRPQVSRYFLQRRFYLPFTPVHK